MYISKWVVGCGMNKEEARAQSYLRKKRTKKKSNWNSNKKKPNQQKKEAQCQISSQYGRQRRSSTSNQNEENYVPRMLQCCCELRSSLEIEIVAMLNRLNIFILSLSCLLYFSRRPNVTSNNNNNENIESYMAQKSTEKYTRRQQ